MFKKVAVPILGIVENMATFICPNCGHASHIFGHGGARVEAQRLGVPFLGEVPLNMTIRETSDAGRPVVATDPEGPQAKVYREIATALWANLSGAGPARSAPKDRVRVGSRVAASRPRPDPGGRPRAADGRGRQDPAAARRTADPGADRGAPAPAMSGRAGTERQRRSRAVRGGLSTGRSCPIPCPTCRGRWRAFWPGWNRRRRLGRHSCAERAGDAPFLPENLVARLVASLGPAPSRWRRPAGREHYTAALWSVALQDDCGRGWRRRAPGRRLHRPPWGRRGELADRAGGTRSSTSTRRRISPARRASSRTAAHPPPRGEVEGR